MKMKEEKKPIKLEQKHWIIIAIASFALVLTLVLCLAFCGKDDDKGDGGASDPSGTYEEDGGYTGDDGELDPNWDTNI